MPQSTDSTTTIQLTKGYVTVIDAVDADLAALKWCTYLSRNHAYAARLEQRHKQRTVYRLHRVVLERALGRELLAAECVDHINGDTMDNRRANLRLATRSQNKANSRRPRSNTSGYKGVKWSKKHRKWEASIKVNYRLRFLGYFNAPEEAYEAYCQAAKQYFGEFARLE